MVNGLYKGRVVDFAPMQAVRVDNIFKEYGTFQAVNGLSFDIEKGECLDFSVQMVLESLQQLKSLQDSFSLVLDL